MVTILDIAKEAGVSHGTVSNVLNGKGNVSSEKMELVIKAAEKLGYNLNNNAKLLRSGKSKTIILIMPNFTSEEYSIFYEKALKEANRNDYQIRLYCTNDNPILEKQIIREIIKERPAGIIAISSLEQADEYYDYIRINKSDILFVHRKPKNAQKFITFDFQQAGTDIATFVNEHFKGKVGLFLGEEDFLHENMFKKAFMDRLKSKDIYVLSSKMTHEYEDGFKMIQQAPFNCIITTNVSKAEMLMKAYDYGSNQQLPVIISLAPLKNIYKSEVIFYFQDHGFLGEKVVKKIIQTRHLKSKEHSNVYQNYGFLTQDIKYHTQQSDIHILTINSPTTHALTKIIPHFEKNTSSRIHLDIKTYNEVFEIIEDETKWKKYDIIRLDIAGFSWYGQKIYRPLKGLDPHLDAFIEELPYFLQETYVNIHDTVFAVPFDVSIQMLFYRKDIFENDIVQRKFYEQTKSELIPPSSFYQYNEILQFMNDSDYDFLKELKGASMISGNAETIAAEFLLRYYSLGGSLLHNSDIGLERNSASEALKLLFSNYKNSLVMDSNWWGAEVKAFMEGKSAMVIGFLNHLSIVSQSTLKDFIGIADVPGNTPLLGGGILGITKSTTNEQAAIDFLNWLNSPEISEQINLLGGNTANYFLSKNSVVRSMYPWLEKLKKTMMNGKRESSFKNGQSLDLKHTEETIGLYVIELLKEDHPDFEKCVDQINETLDMKKARFTIQA